VRRYLHGLFTATLALASGGLWAAPVTAAEGRDTAVYRSWIEDMKVDERGKT